MNKKTFGEFEPHPWWYIPPFEWQDPYHWILNLSWPMFLLCMAFWYIGINILFAFAYLLQPGCIANARPGNFGDAFFFSLQTISTVGYGAMSPTNLYGHIVVSIEVWVGLLGLALITGLMFSRFSRPTARILFSRWALVSSFNGQQTFMFRVANQRGNRILEAQIRVSLLREEMTQEGYEMYRFYDLPLVRSQTPVFGLTWLVMHTINVDSALWQETIDSLKLKKVQFFVTLTGLDETVSQTIHAHHNYTLEQLQWNARFKDVVRSDSKKKRIIEYDRFHEFERVDEIQKISS